MHTLRQHSLSSLGSQFKVSQKTVEKKLGDKKGEALEKLI